MCNKNKGARLLQERRVMRVGETRTITEVAKWHECEVCGYPAKYRITFLNDGDAGARRNPGSSAFGRDDCSWCSDHETYACQKHKKQLERKEPSWSYHWCASFPLKEFKHMGFYWKRIKT